MHHTITRRRLGALMGGAALAGASGCANAPDPNAGGPVASMGSFRLGHNIVVVDNVKQIPPSRRASPEAWQASLRSEVGALFGRYGGPETFHVAVAIDGYALAPPGIPVVLTPKSILVVTANLWSAREGRKVLGPEQLTVFEGPEALLLGSGLIKSAEEQMTTLSRNMAARIQRWIVAEGAPLLGLPPG